MKRRSLLLSGLAALGGCASGVWSLPSYDDLPPDKSGVAIASVGGQWVPPNARFSVAFRPVASPGTVGEFYFLRNNIFAQSPVDIQNDPLFATVAVRRLPPGNYEISGASVSVGAPPVQSVYFDKRPFSFPFEIIAGKATYLGEFLGYPVVGKGVLGLGPTIGAVFTVRDRQARDLELLQKRGVDLHVESVVNAVMDKAQAANSIFVRLQDAK